LNKILGAVLGTFLIMFGLNEAAHMLVHPHELEEAAYPIEVPEGGASGAEDGAAAVDIGALLAAADPARGATFARTLCGACHTFDEGGGTLTGPNLYDIVGRPVASVDFAFTPAMKNHGGEWSYEALWAFLEAPPRVTPGTAMTFAGLTREDQRANVIAYLGTLAASPVPFPDPLPAEEPAEAGGEGDADAAGESTTPVEPEE
jgi:cytochrome c